MVVYSNKNEFVASVRPFVSEATRGRRFLTIMSDEPSRDGQMLYNGPRSALGLQDAHGLLSGSSDKLSLLKALLTKQEKQYRSGNFEAWTWVANWEHLLYDRFESVLRIEHYFDEPRPTTTVCCFKNEGFCSLPISQIRELVELHTQIVLNRGKH
jgi:hypothetical protein